MSPLHWLLALVSLVGVIMNIRRRRESYAIWMATNTLWCAVDLAAGLHAQGALMATYAGLAIWGFVAWRPHTLSRPE